jgi:(R,R)-butanediol dehydrogenase/meso-butanediol dehydrogenase/diacetyl reductase
MKAIVWLEKDRIEIREVPVPKPAANEVLIRVGWTGICGSDLTIVGGHHPRAKAPLILGHEFMGTVADPLPAGAAFKSGQRVVVEPLLACGKCRPCREGHDHVCRSLRLLGVEADGGFAQFVAAPAGRVYPLPDGLADDKAAMMEPLAVAVHAVDYGNPRPQDMVAVLGAGPIGLLVAQVARAAGVERIWVCEVEPSRLRRAEALGLQTIDTSRVNAVEAILEKTGGEGSDVTFDTAGVPLIAEQLIPLTGIRGRIVMVAIHKKPASVLFQQLAYREQVILGTRIYARGNFARAIELAASGRIDLNPLITHRFTMAEALQAFEKARSASESCKVLIQQP